RRAAQLVVPLPPAARATALFPYTTLFRSHLPLEAAPIRFASWMGGDRDGNPNVTAAVTREVLLLARWMAADLYLRDVDSLAAELDRKSTRLNSSHVKTSYAVSCLEKKTRW